MKGTLIAPLTVFCILAACAADSHDTKQQFDAFVQRYAKVYASNEERQHRFAVFERNMERARQLQAQNPHATFGVNEFADMSAEEFAAPRVKSAAALEAARKVMPDATLRRERTVPSKIDWRQHDAVTPVSNQGQCGGGCVAYTVVENVEGVNAVTNGKLIPLSAQEVASCAMGDDGCCGGFPTTAIQWFLDNTDGKIATAKSWPYNSSSGIAPPCSHFRNRPTGAQITSLIIIPKNESALVQETGSTGPIAVGVNALDWQTYTGGVLTNCSPKQLDHAAAVVGYDLESSPPYWIIKNSWGASWGEQGYIRIGYGSNQCGIKEMASTVTVATTR